MSNIINTNQCVKGTVCFGGVCGIKHNVIQVKATSLHLFRDEIRSIFDWEVQIVFFAV